MNETRRVRAVVAILVAAVLAGLVLVAPGTEHTDDIRVGAGGAAAGGAAAGGAAAGGAAPQSGARTWRSSLRPEQGSGRSGTAVLTVAGQGSTRIEVTLGGDTTEPLAAHVHVGSCGSHDPRPTYVLVNVERGRSDTVVPVDLQDLLSRKFSIRIQSTRRSATVACGELVGG